LLMIVISYVAGLGTKCTVLLILLQSAFLLLIKEKFIIRQYAGLGQKWPHTSPAYPVSLLCEAAVLTYTF
jgi:hypothetical protein